ncbi:MAG: glycine/betaine ABC transporter permease [Desulfitibacter sp. BRH_c19]|nr:MAG: glycine/betaine ABC transporter permease [Desulfitibacter sp. BRH_c19]
MEHKGKIDPIVFYVSLVLCMIFVAWGVISPANLNSVSGAVLNYLIANFGWLYLLSAFIFLIFVIYLAVSRYGTIKLGKDNESPEYSTFAWLAMLFTTGMGIGLVFWSVAEPMTHYINPPMGEGGTTEAAGMAMKYTFFHWGLHAWAIFALVGLALAYFQFRKGKPGLISSVFYPILGDKVDGPIGKTIDILAVFATIFGLGTSLGLGTQQINSGLEYLYGIPNSPMVNIIIIVVITTIFTGAAIVGIEKAIALIAKLTVYGAIGLLVFLILFGPTRFIFNIFSETLGSYLGQIIPMSLWTDAIEQKGWSGGWTIFYWAWWIAWGPFVGQFIARISRGRTIREFVLGVLLVPTVFSVLWLSVFGGSGLFLEIVGGVDISTAVNNDMASALFVTLSNFPISSITSVLAILLISAFFITSADSGTFVVGMLTSKGSFEPSNWVKGIWGTILGGVAAVLLLSGGLGALQTASIVSAFPFMLVMLVMMYSLLKAFSEEV